MFFQCTTIASIIIEQHKSNYQANKNTTLDSHHNKRCFDYRDQVQKLTQVSQWQLYIGRVISLPGPKMVISLKVNKQLKFLLWGNYQCSGDVCVYPPLRNGCLHY